MRTTKTLSIILPFSVAVLMAMGCITTGGTGTTTAEEIVKAAGIRPTEDRCFTGLFIIGEGQHAGKIELQGCPKEHVVYHVPGRGNTDPPDFGKMIEGKGVEMIGKSVIKLSDEPSESILLDRTGPGVWVVPSELLQNNVRATVTIENGVLYIHTNLGDPVQEAQSHPLNPFMRVSSVVSVSRKYTPFVFPQAMGPAVYPAERATGQIVGEGRAFHLLTHDEQLCLMFIFNGKRGNEHCDAVNKARRDYSLNLEVERPEEE